MRVRLFVVAVLMAFVAGCGFQLRGAYSLPYESLFVSGTDYSPVIAGLKRAIRASGSARLADTAQDAQATFVPTIEAYDPTYLEEMRGIAAGADVALEDITQDGLNGYTDGTTRQIRVDSKMAPAMNIRLTCRVNYCRKMLAASKFLPRLESCSPCSS